MSEKGWSHFSHVNTSHRMTMSVSFTLNTCFILWFYDIECDILHLTVLYAYILINQTLCVLYYVFYLCELLMSWTGPHCKTDNLYVLSCINKLHKYTAVKKFSIKLSKEDTGFWRVVVSSQIKISSFCFHWRVAIRPAKIDKLFLNPPNFKTDARARCLFIFYFFDWATHRLATTSSDRGMKSKTSKNTLDIIIVIIENSS